MQILNKYKDKDTTGAIYIGRGSYLGNLRVIGKDGTREEVIAWYRGWLIDKLLKRDQVIENVFRGFQEDTKLLCFCAPKPCHGNVIKELWEIIMTAPSYEEGLELLKCKQEPIVENIASQYKEWLVSELRKGNGIVGEDFRTLNLTDNLIPQRFRSYPNLTEEIILPLFRELVDGQVYEQAIIDLHKKYGKGADYDPKNDGVTHINIYSKGRTDLGRALSNFAKIGFTHPEYGTFASVEGFWYWLKTGKRHEQFKELYGYDAKKFGKDLPRVEVEDFETTIKEALFYKVDQHPKLKQVLAQSTLPFSHYYYYGELDNCKVYADKGGDWIIEYIELLRLYAQGRAKVLLIAGSREITDYGLLKSEYLKRETPTVMIVSGMARGVDTLGLELAKEFNLPVSRCPANWDAFGKGAGMIRNRYMASICQEAIVLWDGQSLGTKGMMGYLKSLKKPFTVINPFLKPTESHILPLISKTDIKLNEETKQLYLLRKKWLTAAKIYYLSPGDDSGMHDAEWDYIGRGLYEKRAQFPDCEILNSPTYQGGSLYWVKADLYNEMLKLYTLPSTQE